MAPVAYCARCCWPMTRKELSTVTRLGCYRCATVDSVFKTADKHKISLILIEDGRVTKFKDWNWKDKYLKPLKERGYDVHGSITSLLKLVPVKTGIGMIYRNRHSRERGNPELITLSST